MNESPLWEISPGESEAAYAAFIAYRDKAPGERSCAKVGQDLCKSRTLLTGWCAKFRWRLRCQAWDEEVQRQIDATHLKALVESAKRKRQLGTILQNKVMLALAKLDPEKMTVKEILEMVQVGVELENEGLGMPSKTTGVTISSGPAPNISTIKLYDSSVNLDAV